MASSSKMVGTPKGEQSQGTGSEDQIYLAGMLAERGRNAFGFLHLTFQEYYVARYLARLQPAERWAILQSKINYPRWHDPILLCAGWLGLVEKDHSAVEQLLNQILNANSPHEAILHRNLFLATAIMSEKVGLSDVWLTDTSSK